MTLKKNQKVVNAISDMSCVYENAKGYRKLKIPASGTLLTDKDIKKNQISIDDADL